MSTLATNPEMNVPLHAEQPQFESLEIVDDRFRVDQIIHGPNTSNPQSHVYTAQDMDTGEKVALKIPLTNDDETAPRAIREAVLSEVFSAKSNNVAKFVAAGVSEDRDAPFMYIASEFMGGGSVHEEMKAARNGRLAVASVLNSAPAFDALAMMHEDEILHRDIKPGNIFKDINGRGKLGDFGNAGARSQEPELLTDYNIPSSVVSESLTANGSFHGTPGFIAPEAILGNGFTEKSDVFAAGATLFSPLTGKPLPNSPNRLSVQRQGSVERALHQFAELYERPGLAEIPEDVPSSLGYLALSCLEEKPENRPTMREVSDQLNEMAAQYN